jgi:hypothetical protein
MMEGAVAGHGTIVAQPKLTRSEDPQIAVAVGETHASGALFTRWPSSSAAERHARFTVFKGQVLAEPVGRALRSKFVPRSAPSAMVVE